MKNITRNIFQLFDWKHYPHRVFYIAIPLAFVALSLSLLQAVLEIVFYGEWGYVIIWIAAITLFVVGIMPIWRPLVAAVKNGIENDRY